MITEHCIGAAMRREVGLGACDYAARYRVPPTSLGDAARRAELDGDSESEGSRRWTEQRDPALPTGIFVHLLRDQCRDYERGYGGATVDRARPALALARRVIG